MADSSGHPLRTKALQLRAQLLIPNFSAVCAKSRRGVEQKLLPGAWTQGLLSHLLLDHVLFSYTSRPGSAGVEGRVTVVLGVSIALLIHSSAVDFKQVPSSPNSRSVRLFPSSLKVG